MTQFIVGPDGTRYKIIRNPLPDPQDYGHVEPVADRERVLEAQLEGTRALWKEDARTAQERLEAAEKRVAELWKARKEGEELQETQEREILTLEKRVAELEEARPCLNCGSRERMVMCEDCGRLNPADVYEASEEKP